MKKTLKRRRQENKTDYAKRIKLLKGELPRIVVRKTNKYIIVQYVTSKEAQDKILAGVSSKVLLDYGWPKEAKGSLKSIPAAYLTGYLFGKKISPQGKEKNPIMDFGIIRNLHKTKIYAVVKGLIDAGVQIKYKKNIFPDENRIKGEHMKNKINVEAIKSKIIKE